MNARKLYFSSAWFLGLSILAGALALLGTWGGRLPVVQAKGADAYSTYYVAPAGSACGAMIPCYDNVQDAIDAVDDPGDVIKVATGVYSDVNGCGGLSQVAYITKSLTIRGGYTTSDWDTSDPEAYTTTLDAHQQGRAVYISGDIDVTVEALRLTGGDATLLEGGLFDEDSGGGVYVHSAVVTLTRNTIVENSANSDGWVDGLGGGVYLYQSGASIVSNTVANNHAATDSWSDGYGGGLYADGSILTLRGNVVLNNQAAVDGFLAGGGGGGLYFVESQPTLEANQIRDNRAGGDYGTGGGVEIDACSGFALVNNLIADNHADYGGSGLWIGRMSGVPSSGRLLHSTIASNQAGAYEAEGVRVEQGGVVTMVNTILVDHDIGVVAEPAATVVLTATLWGSGSWANITNTVAPTDATVISSTNLTGDPVFLAPAAGDYHIAFSSAAKDEGVDAGIGADLDGASRDANPDLGAYEAKAQGLLRVTKAAFPTILNPGGIVTYTIVVTNAGAISVTNVVFTDTLPTLQRPLDVLYDRGSCAKADASYGGRVRCDLDDLQAGQGAHITITARVTMTVPATLPQTMRNTARGVCDQNQSVAYADTILQDCHARVGGALLEYTTVQAAVDAAGEGDEVWIAGVCTGAFERQGLFQQVYLTKSLTLRGGYSTDFSAWDPDAYTTTLDARGQGRVIYVEGLLSATVEALTLTGGDATGQGGSFMAGDDAGGGLYAFGATVTLSRSHVTGNVATSRMYGYGGGAAVVGADLTLIATTLADNVASNASGGQGQGGGLSGEVSTVHLEKSRFENNTAVSAFLGAAQGGGAYFYQSDLEANATLWLSNTVSPLGWIEGGGLFVAGSAPFTLTNCVLADNDAEDGSALYAMGLYEGMSGVLVHPTIARNSGGVGVSVGYTATVAITNAVIAGHEVGILATEGSTVTVDGVLWHDNLTNTLAVAAMVQVSGEVTGTPAFASDGYHLTAASAAVNKGVAAGVAVDIDGDPRVGAPDLGVDEYVWDHTVYLPLVVRDS